MSRLAEVAEHVADKARGAAGAEDERGRPPTTDAQTSVALGEPGGTRTAAMRRCKMRRTRSA
jgi:hypothetical protein